MEVEPRIPIRSHSPIRPRAHSKSAGENQTALPEAGKWLADLHGLRVMRVLGHHGSTPVWRHFGESPVEIGALVPLDQAWLARLAADETLLLSNRAAALQGVAAALESDEALPLLAAVETTHGQSILGIGGPGVRAILRKLTGLDLRERSFPDRRAAQTSLARIRTTILRFDLKDDRNYILIAQRSAGQYLWDVILDALNGESISVIEGSVLRAALFPA